MKITIQKEKEKNNIYIYMYSDEYYDKINKNEIYD